MIYKRIAALILAATLIISCFPVNVLAQEMIETENIIAAESEDNVAKAMQSDLNQQVSQVSLGSSFSAAIKKDGSLWMWGLNYNGQLGNNSNTGSSAPKKVPGMDNVTQVSLGYSHAAAIKQDGTLWMWGYNSTGQLGNNGTVDSNVPIKVQGMDNVDRVFLGYGFSTALKHDGSLWIWGSDGADDFYPTPVKILDDVIQASCGNGHLAAIKRDGSLWMWGNNNCGQLGNNSTVDTHKEPIKVPGMDNVTQVSLGAGYSAALKNDGTLWMWGANNYGELGNNSTEYSYVPIKIMDNVTQVSLGERHSAAIKKDGTLWMWGYNFDGELGINNTEDSHVPVQVHGIDNVAQVDLGSWHSAAIKNDGTLWMWGENFHGQLGNYSKNYSYVPIQIMIGNESIPIEPSTDAYKIRVVEEGTNNPLSNVRIGISSSEEKFTDSNGYAEFNFPISNMVTLTKSGYLDKLILNSDLNKDSVNTVYMSKDETIIPEPSTPGNGINDKNFNFGRDNFNFYNLGAMKDISDSQDYKNLMNKLSPGDVFMAKRHKHEDGHCYGMSVISSFKKRGKIKDSRLDGKYLYSLKQEDIQSLICTYQLIETTKVRKDARNNYLKSHGYKNLIRNKEIYKASLKELEQAASQVEKGALPVVITYRYHKNGSLFKHGHAVIGCSVQEGDFLTDYTNHTYNKKIVIYDTNAIDGNGKSVHRNDFDLYYNDETGDWEVPYYTKENPNNKSGWQINSSDKADFQGFLTTEEQMDPINYTNSNIQSTANSGTVDVTVTKSSGTLTIKNNTKGLVTNIDLSTGNMTGYTDDIIITAPCTDATDSETMDLNLPYSEDSYTFSSDSALDIIVQSDNNAIDIKGSGELTYYPEGKVVLNNANNIKTLDLANNLNKTGINIYELGNVKSKNLEINLNNQGLNLQGDNLKGTVITGKKNIETKDSVTINNDLNDLDLKTSGDKLQSNQEDFTHDKQPNQHESSVKIYRLYNQESGEHLYTSDQNEYNVLPSVGWTQEGVGWNAPSSGTAVYRLYNPTLADHLYTTDENEYRVLTTERGWQADNNGKPLFYSGGTVPVYRLYHEGILRHLLTKDENENNVLGNGGGWNKEGVKLYALSDQSGQSSPSGNPSNPTNSEPNKKLERITLSPDSLELTVGGRRPIYPVYYPEHFDSSGSSIGTWSSSNPSVVEVSRLGWLTALSKGEATITFEREGIKGTCQVTVK